MRFNGTTTTHSATEVAIITGGATGIGYALAREFLSHGEAVLLIGRSKSRLDKAKSELSTEHGAMVWTLDADIADPSVSDKLKMFLKQEQLELKTLVNNAAAWHQADVDRMGQEEIAAIISTNISGPVRLTKNLLPLIAKSTSGGIINIGSLAGEMPYPNATIYGASKAFIHSWSRALRTELRAKKIRVCLVVPGAVATDFTAENRNLKFWQKPFVATPEAVAWTAYRGYRSGYTKVVPTLSAWFLHLGLFLLPTAASVRIRQVLS